nr:hypothetical protein [Tanacetum cinerariifolium]
MALPDKHQLKFNSYKDAKTLMEAIEKHFGLDQIHDKLQNLVSQLEIHRVSLSQEDVNMNFLRSLPSDWKTHTLIWQNKANLEDKSLDDLFISLKIYKTEVKHSSSTSTESHNLALYHPLKLTALLTKKLAQRTYASRDTRKQYASLSPSQSYTHVVPTVVLPQSKLVLNTAARPINVDDLEEMDLRWQMAMLTMRARRVILQEDVDLPRIKKGLVQLNPREGLSQHAYRVVTKSYSPIRRHLPCSPSSKNSTSPPRVTAAKALVVSAAQGKKGT